jgi:hypothetical protein
MQFLPRRKRKLLHYGDQTANAAYAHSRQLPSESYETHKYTTWLERTVILMLKAAAHTVYCAINDTVLGSIYI